MICSINTMTVNGIQGSPICVECYISNGLPAFDIVGLPDAAVKEARERVRAAVKVSGMKFPSGRITVNLAPANMKKSVRILICRSCWVLCLPVVPLKDPGLPVLFWER